MRPKKTDRKKKKFRSTGLQLALFNQKLEKTFGGSQVRSHPKTARPLSLQRPIHLVLKSGYALGAKSMLRPHFKGKIENIVKTQAHRWDVKIYHFVNVGNHLHLVIRLKYRDGYSSFIRSVTGLIARLVTGRQRGSGSSSTSNSRDALMRSARSQLSQIVSSRRGESSKGGPAGSFWVARPFSRLISWGRDYNSIHRYMEKNRNQARGRFGALGFDVLGSDRSLSLNSS